MIDILVVVATQRRDIIRVGKPDQQSVDKNLGGEMASVVAPPD